MTSSAKIFNRKYEQKCIEWCISFMYSCLLMFLIHIRSRTLISGFHYFILSSVFFDFFVFSVSHRPWDHFASPLYDSLVHWTSIGYNSDRNRTKILIFRLGIRNCFWVSTNLIIFSAIVGIYTKCKFPCSVHWNSVIAASHDSCHQADWSWSPWLIYLRDAKFFIKNFLLFHPKNYYKLSLRVTFSNTFDNLYKSYMPVDIYSINYSL